MNGPGPHGRPDADQQAFWDLVRHRHYRETGSWPTDIDLATGVDHLNAIRRDDETIDAVIAGSDMDPYERDRILHNLAGKPVHGCVSPEDADVTLRAMLGGYRNAIHARKMPPLNIDAGRVAFLIEQRRRRQARRARIRSIIGWATLAILAGGFLALCLAIVASAHAHPGDALWWIHQLVYYTTS